MVTLSLFSPDLLQKQSLHKPARPLVAAAPRGEDGSGILGASFDSSRTAFTLVRFLVISLGEELSILVKEQDRVVEAIASWWASQGKRPGPPKEGQRGSNVESSAEK